MVWIFVFPLLLISGVAIVGNAAIPIRYWLTQKTCSMVPLAGGLCGALGLWIVPIEGARFWWWVPPLVDLGCVPQIAILIPFLIRRRRRRQLGQCVNCGTDLDDPQTRCPDCGHELEAPKADC